MCHLLSFCTVTYSLHVPPCAFAELLCLDAVEFNHASGNLRNTSHDAEFVRIVFVGDSYNVTGDDGILSIVSDVVGELIILLLSALDIDEYRAFPATDVINLALVRPRRLILGDMQINQFLNEIVHLLRRFVFYFR